MTIVITPALALAYLARAVNEKGPDFAFSTDPDDEGNPSDSGCMYYYVREGETPEPCCIVGHVFDYAGVDPTLIVVDNQLNAKALFEFNDIPGLEITPGADRILSAAQDQQDQGLTWGEAYKRAADVFMSLPEEFR